MIEKILSLLNHTDNYNIFFSKYFLHKFDFVSSCGLRYIVETAPKSTNAQEPLLRLNQKCNKDDWPLVYIFEKTHPVLHVKKYNSTGS